MLINNLKAFLSTVHVVSNENCLKTIVEESAKTCFTIFTNFDYPYLKNKKCDLRLVDKDTIFWIELKDNITLLPIGSSRIIYEMNKLVFLDIARLLVGVNNRYDHRLIIANISKAFIDDYYGINPQQIMKGSFTAEDVLPVSADRRKFVELKIEASIEMHFLQFSGGYLIVAQILDGFVNTNIYKNLDSRGSEGECKKKTYVDGDDVNKQYFFQEYFPSS
ncbi:MAG: hypothetical protein GX556_04045 [Fibrobacter sp.]|nr:hypothetical protein [Fibrobacter sp.]